MTLIWFTVRTKRKGINTEMSHNARAWERFRMIFVARNRFCEHVLPSWTVLLNLFSVVTQTLCISIPYYLQCVTFSSVSLTFQEHVTTDGSSDVDLRSTPCYIILPTELPSWWGVTTCSAYMAGCEARVLLGHLSGNT